MAVEFTATLVNSKTDRQPIARRRATALSKPKPESRKGLSSSAANCIKPNMQKTSRADWSQLRPWLLVLTGDFYGIIHSINGVLLALITGKGPYNCSKIKVTFGKKKHPLNYIVDCLARKSSYKLVLNGELDVKNKCWVNIKDCVFAVWFGMGNQGWNRLWFKIRVIEIH